MKSTNQSRTQCAGKVMMVLFFCWLFIVSLEAQNPGVSINTTGNPPDPSAILDVTSSTKGVLIPRVSMFTLPVSPATGLMVYIQDINPGFWYFDGSIWNKIMPTSEQRWFGSPDIYYLGGNVGIGTSLPSAKLTIAGNSATNDGVDVNMTGAGDPQLRFQLAGLTKYSLGIDNSDADKFKIGTSAISTSARITISVAGNTGIGTENPAATLHLNGTAKVFGPWETKVQGVDYLATTDGFVNAGLLILPGSGDANAGLKGYTDQLTHPVAIRGLACVRKIYPGTQNGQDSFSMPVRKGEYWRVEYTYLEGDISYVIEWIPFGTNNP